MSSTFHGARIRTADNPLLLLTQKFLPIWQEAYTTLYNEALAVLRKSSEGATGTNYPSIEEALEGMGGSESAGDPEKLTRFLNRMEDERRGEDELQSHLNDMLTYGTLSTRRNPYDLGFQAVLIPDPEEPEWTYVLMYGTTRWIQLLLDQDWIEEYYYTNRTDSQIRDIGVEEYEQREKLWSRLVPLYQPSAEIGFVWNPAPPIAGIASRLRGLDMLLDPIKAYKAIGVKAPAGI